MGLLDLLLAPPRLALRALDDLHKIAAETERAFDGRTSMIERLDQVGEGIQGLTDALPQVFSLGGRLDATLTSLDAVIRDVVAEASSVARVGGEVRDVGQPLVEHVAALRAIAEELGRVGRELRGSGEDLAGVGRELYGGGQELTDVARQVRDRGDTLDGTGRALDGTAVEIRDGGRELTDVAKQLRGVARELRDGGRELTVTAKGLDAKTAGAIEEIRDAEQSIDDVQDSVEAIAETVEPLQGAAERVGRLTDRLPSRRR